MQDKMKRMQELVELLNRARKAYEQEDKEIISNYEYDKLYDELAKLEKELGTILSSSPTVNVGYEVLSELPKERHEKPMLSLDKTKEISQLKEFLGEKNAVISWKLDGLTIVLTYQDGSLQKAVTRGNGEIGEVITNNAKVFQNLPLQIPYQGEVILRGEAVIGYKDFERINSQIPEADAKYKNPRNLCSGSVRQLNNEITAQRNVKFVAFNLVKADGVEFENSRMKQFDWMQEQGFEVVEHHIANRENIEGEVEWFSHQILENDLPSDGLVLVYDDIEYGKSLGTTAKFPRDSYAFKWADEIRETTLLEIEWSPSRTGLINPVAIFEPVELEGTTVSRASVHNLSIMEELELGIGDVIQVYKANMIIPQIAENLTRSGVCEIPKECPVCGGSTKIKVENDTKTLYCINPQCQAKQVKSFALFVSRDAMNIEGFSEKTAEKLLEELDIRDLPEIYEIKFEDLIKLEGFKEKKTNNLLEAIEKSKEVSLASFIYALGINNVGIKTATDLANYFKSLDRLKEATFEELIQVGDIGPIIANSILEFFHDKEILKAIDKLLGEGVTPIYEEVETSESIFTDKTVVITGTIEGLTRNEIKDLVEKMGGKVTGSVSKKTDFVIVGENPGSKYNRAVELGIEIIGEERLKTIIDSE